LAGRGLCDELIARPEESYRLWCVVVCDLETSTMRRPWSALGSSATAKKKVLTIWIKYYTVGCEWNAVAFAYVFFFLSKITSYHSAGCRVIICALRAITYRCDQLLCN